MRVFRIESKAGDGPYSRPNDVADWWSSGELARCHRTEKHPTPQREGLLVHDRICGFVVIENLKEWFRGWRSKLRKAGFFMAIYEVPVKACEIGEKQLVFDRDQATLIERLEIP